MKMNDCVLGIGDRSCCSSIYDDMKLSCGYKWRWILWWDMMKIKIVWWVVVVCVEKYKCEEGW